MTRCVSAKTGLSVSAAQTQQHAAQQTTMAQASKRSATPARSVQEAHQGKQQRAARQLAAEGTMPGVQAGASRTGTTGRRAGVAVGGHSGTRKAGMVPGVVGLIGIGKAGIGGRLVGHQAGLQGAGEGVVDAIDCCRSWRRLVLWKPCSAGAKLA